MGIYPHRERTPTSTGYLETIQTPGLIRRRELTAGEWTEEWTNCFCCSCPEGSVDSSCRNHGWWGARPCDLHGMAGEANENGIMPASVQDHRRDAAAKH